VPRRASRERRRRTRKRGWGGRRGTRRRETEGRKMDPGKETRGQALRGRGQQSAHCWRSAFRSARAGTVWSITVSRLGARPPSRDSSSHRHCIPLPTLVGLPFSFQPDPHRHLCRLGPLLTSHTARRRPPPSSRARAHLGPAPRRCAHVTIHRAPPLAGRVGGATYHMTASWGGAQMAMPGEVRDLRPRRWRL
jgi:hypothetical protein